MAQTILQELLRVAMTKPTVHFQSIVYTPAPTVTRRNSVSGVRGRLPQQCELKVRRVRTKAPLGVALWQSLRNRIGDITEIHKLIKAKGLKGKVQGAKPGLAGLVPASKFPSIGALAQKDAAPAPSSGADENEKKLAEEEATRQLQRKSRFLVML